MVVKGNDRSIVALFRGEHAAAPQHVIDGDDAIRRQEREGGLVVVGVVRLVGVDEDEVELPETTEEIDANDDEVAANAGPDEEADEDEADDGGEVEDDDADLDEDDGNDQSA